MQTAAPHNPRSRDPRLQSIQDGAAFHEQFQKRAGSIHIRLARFGDTNENATVKRKATDIRPLKEKTHAGVNNTPARDL